MEFAVATGASPQPPPPPSLPQGRPTPQRVLQSLTFARTLRCQWKQSSVTHCGAPATNWTPQTAIKAMLCLKGETAGSAMACQHHGHIYLYMPPQSQRGSGTLGIRCRRASAMLQNACCAIHEGTTWLLPQLVAPAGDQVAGAQLMACTRETAASLFASWPASTGCRRSGGLFKLEYMYVLWAPPACHYAHSSKLNVQCAGGDLFASPQG